ncbi:MAG: SDR family NAD(P)-dependent oxidoreductase [Kiritimatiellae bacterium]|nr:SDR family NAD(P)-dependent oxidoreductase [Kiritimatiellia bacterium]
MNETTFKIDNRVAVVTGAAGNIGLATCRLLCEAGTRVIATDVSEEGLAVGLAPLRERGFDIRAYALDVTDLRLRKNSFPASRRISARSTSL